jgi:hypothetical protein
MSGEVRSVQLYQARAGPNGATFGLAEKLQDFGEFLADCIERRAGVAEQGWLGTR